MQRHQKYKDTEIEIIQVLCRMTINNRTQKLNKHYTDTTTKQNILYEHRNSTSIMQRHQKYEDTEIK